MSSFVSWLNGEERVFSPPRLQYLKTANAVSQARFHCDFKQLDSPRKSWVILQMRKGGM